MCTCFDLTLGWFACSSSNSVCEMTIGSPFSVHAFELPGLVMTENLFDEIETCLPFSVHAFEVLGLVMTEKSFMNLTT